ncbi:hypothetical protein [Nocardia wallacei]|nr:hypothetical protein [Nocardia wallacei]
MTTTRLQRDPRGCHEMRWRTAYTTDEVVAAHTRNETRMLSARDSQ